MYREADGHHEEGIAELRRPGEQYLLTRHLLNRAATGQQVAPWATTFNYPFRHRYHVLRALDYAHSFKAEGTALGAVDRDARRPRRAPLAGRTRGRRALGTAPRDHTDGAGAALDRFEVTHDRDGLRALLASWVGMSDYQHEPPPAQ